MFRRGLTGRLPSAKWLDSGLDSRAWHAGKAQLTRTVYRWAVPSIVVNNTESLPNTQHPLFTLSYSSQQASVCRHCLALREILPSYIYRDALLNTKRKLSPVLIPFPKPLRCCRSYVDEQGMVEPRHHQNQLSRGSSNVFSASGSWVGDCSG